jgi:fumarylacetoacetate (FAA) hydrolase
MRLISFYADRDPDDQALVAGVIEGDWAVDLSVAGQEAGLPFGMSELDLGDMLQLGLIDLDELSELATHAVELATEGKTVDDLPLALPLADVELAPPLALPTSMRDFYAFEQHVKAARARRGLDIIPEWYEIPVFYFTNHNAVVGPGASVIRPAASRELDFELEIAAVIWQPGIDIPAEEADSHILGFTIMNDWSARDLQRREMKLNLGPAKGKDFATSLGPWITTLDELADRATGDGRWDLTMTARINGTEVSRGNFKDITFTFGQILEHASADVVLWPGDVLGSGTVGTGCILELGPENVPWLEPGDVVELEIERLGTLRNTVEDRGEAPAE